MVYSSNCQKNWRDLLFISFYVSFHSLIIFIFYFFLRILIEWYIGVGITDKIYNALKRILYLFHWNHFHLDFVNGVVCPAPLNHITIIAQTEKSKLEEIFFDLLKQFVVSNNGIHSMDTPTMFFASFRDKCNLLKLRHCSACVSGYE